MNENVNTNFISPVKSTFESDVAFKERTTDQVSFFCVLVVFMKRFNVSGCQKKVSKTNDYVMTTTERSTYLATLTSMHRIAISVPF